MRPVSEKFLRVLRGSHRMTARARICAPGQTGVNPDGVVIPIFTGDVQLDATADIRSTVDLTTDGVWPTSAGDTLTPYGNELFVERGIVYGDGVTEWVSLGYHRIDTVEQGQVPSGPIRLAGSDRMSAIVDGRLLSPVQFALGTSVRDVVEYLVQEVYPEAVVSFDFDADDVTLAGSHIAEEDRYDFLLDLVTSLGKVMFWDYEGKLQIQDPPDPAEPAWDVTHGANGVLVAMSRKLDRSSVYNAVVATGEQPGSDGAARAVAYDDNPSSATWWFGNFGRVPRFYSSSFITTNSQAEAAARSMLLTSIGLPYNVDFTSVPNPALEPLDAVRITYSDRAAPEVHVLEQLTVPLAADAAQSATTREQTNVRIGVGNGAL